MVLTLVLWLQEQYYKENVYELTNIVKSLRTVEYAYQNFFHVDLNQAVTAGPGGRPDLDMIDKLEQNYSKGKRLDGQFVGRPIPVYCVQGRENLRSVVQYAMDKIAAPEEVHGAFPGGLSLMQSDLAAFL